MARQEPAMGGTERRGRLASALRFLEPVVLVAVPLSLVACAVCDVQAAAGLTLMVALGAILLMLMSYEASRPALRQIMPTVTLGALAAAGRILFAPLPEIKPVSAIAIVAGATLGRRNGFMVGALAALVSNFFFGQGAWTPWQMYGWGMVGYLSGVLAQLGAFGSVPGGPRRVSDGRGGPPQRRTRSGRSREKLPRGKTRAGQDGLARRQTREELPRKESREGQDNTAREQSRRQHVALAAWGFLSALFYGLILNGWYVIGFVHPITWPAVLAAYAAGFWLDCIHGAATVAFLLLIWGPWGRAIARVVSKYDL